MGKTMLGVFFGLVMVVAGASAAFALQAGGVEIGDLETGSVVGQSFKELDVDAQLFAIEDWNLKGAGIHQSRSSISKFGLVVPSCSR